MGSPEDIWQDLVPSINECIDPDGTIVKAKNMKIVKPSVLRKFSAILAIVG
jgi:hypothetical protein